MSTVTQIEQAIPTGTWKLDPVHSQVGFAVKHNAIALFKGGFDEVEATLADGTLHGAAAVRSIRVQDENLGGHLLSPDFFDAERFPLIRFSSTGLRRQGDAFEADGELELKGVRRPIHLTGTISGPAAGRIGISLETVVDRTEFGVDWNMELPGGGFVLENEVRLTADLELVQEEA